MNFDPANMLLYDKDDPLRVLDLLAPDIRSVHVKDANRPTAEGCLGRGGAARSRGRRTRSSSCWRSRRWGIAVLLCIEREVGTQAERFRDIEHGIRFLRDCLRET